MLYYNLFYFFALMQKSNKKNQGCEKMAKNGGLCLNPPNSPQNASIIKNLLAQTAPGF
jgi:hypothetical protein